MVFFGGLTGVQARLQTPGATLIAQRDIDDAFQSVFIASTSSGIKPVTDVAGLSSVKGKRFTFGSESSTSGRLMPEFFLDQAGVTSEKDFTGAPGYSGSHDKTIDLVAGRHLRRRRTQPPGVEDPQGQGHRRPDQGGGDLHHADVPRLPLDRRAEDE